MLAKVQNQFRNIIEREPEKYYADFLQCKEKVNNSTAIYKNKVVNFLYQGLFFSEGDFKELELLLEGITDILNKVIRAYKENPGFRKLFPFSPLMEELILIETGYQVNFPMGRFDIFYKDNGEHIFCELNTDGSSAMNEIRVLQEVMGESQVFVELKKTYELKGFELFESWLEELIKNYKEFNNGIDDKPNIGILDFTEDGTIYEFREFQKVFQEKGYNTFICDPRELSYKGGKLYYKDNWIRLIYRRATTMRLVEEAGQIGDFLTAYREGAVCVVGGLVSQLVHNKVLFAILHDQNKVDFLTEGEKEYIKRHIPYTALLDVNEEDTIKRLIEEKDHWILKPLDLYAGKGVYAGRDFTPPEWERIIRGLGDKEYIYQEFIEIPVLPMLNFAENKGFENFGFLLGLYTYNHRLAGLYTRAGRKNIIGDIAESFTVPNFICKEV